MRPGPLFERFPSYRTSREFWFSLVSSERFVAQPTSFAKLQDKHLRSVRMPNSRKRMTIECCFKLYEHRLYTFCFMACNWVWSSSSLILSASLSRLAIYHLQRLSSQSESSAVFYAMCEPWQPPLQFFLRLLAVGFPALISSHTSTRVLQYNVSCMLL